LIDKLLIDNYLIKNKKIKKFFKKELRYNNRVKRFFITKITKKTKEKIWLIT